MTHGIEAIIKMGHESLNLNRSHLVTLTFPSKTRPLARKFSCAVMGLKEEADDQETPYRGADRVENVGRIKCSGRSVMRKQLRDWE